jgi:hypothetical protein
MTDLVTRAQIVMLADTLDVEPSRLAEFERLDAPTLRALRERVSDVLFDAQAPVFARVSRLAPLMPDALVAKLSETLVPPLVAGRAAGALGLAHPNRAGAVLSRLSAEYMADCAPYLDPRTIGMLAPMIPTQALVRAANELMRRRDYITACRFLDYASAELVRDFERGIDDDLGLLMTAALTDSPRRLAEIVQLMPPARVRAIVRCAASGVEPLLAGMSLLARLGDELRAELAESFFAGLDPDTRDWVLRSAVEHEAVPEMLVVADVLSPATLGSVGDSPVLAQDGVIERIVERAVASGRRAELETVVCAMGGPAAARARGLLGEAA